MAVTGSGYRESRLASRKMRTSSAQKLSEKRQLGNINVGNVPSDRLTNLSISRANVLCLHLRPGYTRAVPDISGARAVSRVQFLACSRIPHYAPRSTNAHSVETSPPLPTGIHPAYSMHLSATTRIASAQLMGTPVRDGWLTSAGSLLPHHNFL